jgi:type III secretion protein C
MCLRIVSKSLFLPSSLPLHKTHSKEIQHMFLQKQKISKPFCFMLLLLAIFALTCLRPAHAVDPRLGDQLYTLRAQDTADIREILQNIVSRQGMSLVLSPEVNGKFSRAGKFKTRELFDQIIRDFSLLPYFDGSVTYIYAAQEVQSRTFALSPDSVAKVIGTMSQMRITDSRNTFRVNNNDGILFVSGAPRYVADVAELVRATQSLATNSPAVIRFFPLKYAWANDETITFNNREIVVPGVASTLRRLIYSGGGGSAVRQGAADGAERNVAPMAEPKLRSDPSRPNPERKVLPGMPSPEETGGAVAKPVSYESNRLVNLYDSASIEADRRTNGIIIRDSVERMALYEELLKSLDVEPIQVEIQAMIVDVDLNKLKSLGVNWNVKWRNGFQGSGFSANPVTNPLDGKPNYASTALANLPFASGLNFAGILGNDKNFLLSINALAQDDAARIVSRPQVTTLANVEAVIDELQTAYVSVSSAYVTDLYRVTTGTALKVVAHPIIDGDTKKIRLFLSIEDGRFPASTPDQPAIGRTVPFVERATINTQTILFEGESLLIGGLVREKSSTDVTKIPLLGDIPVLGNLFKTQSTSKERKERLFLISPRIVPTNRTPIKDAAFIEKPSVPLIVNVPIKGPTPGDGEPKP